MTVDREQVRRAQAVINDVMNHVTYDRKIVGHDELYAKINARFDAEAQLAKVPALVELRVNEGMIELLIGGVLDTNFGYGVSGEQIMDRLAAYEQAQEPKP